MAEELRDENPLEFEVELPVDVVAASEFAEDAESKVVPYDELPDGWLGLDIGPETREALRRRDRRRRRRSSGTARWASSSGRASPRARRPSPRPSRKRGRVHGRRRRRLGPRADRDGPRRRGRLGLDRRRRCPRAAGRERIAGRGSDPGGHDRADRRQLEDVQGRRPRRPSSASSCARGSPTSRASTSSSARRSPRWPWPCRCWPGRTSPSPRRTSTGRPRAPFTGEVSAPMLRELGVYGAIVGHSERRQLLRRDRRDVAQAGARRARRRAVA